MAVDVEQEVENTETETATERKQLTADQKQAATLRRDATLLEKYGQKDAAAKLYAQADALAPASKQTSRIDPLKVLTASEQNELKNYFRTTAGFARLCQVVSAKKLQEILEGIE
jgi:hypothetical protein